MLLPKCALSYGHTCAFANDLTISCPHIHVPARPQTLPPQSPRQLQTSPPAVYPIPYSTTVNLTSSAPSHPIYVPVSPPYPLHLPRYSSTSSTLSCVHHHFPPAIRIAYSSSISNGTFPHGPVERSKFRVSVYVPLLAMVRKSSRLGSPPSRQMSSG